MSDLAEHIQELQTKHRSEVLHMKQVYEDKIKSLEKDTDDKQTLIYENKTLLTT